MRAIGVIGQGFVGTAIREGFKHVFDVQTYDKNPEKRTCGTLSELMYKTDVVFVAVPTPMKPDGSCDTSIVYSVLDHLNCIARMADRLLVVIIKSTVPPGTTQEFQGKFGYLSLVFNPEFLKEATFLEDFRNQDRIVLGGSGHGINIAKEIYRKAFPGVPIYETAAGVAEMVKYVGNCFLALKVSFSNEIFALCERLGLSHKEVVGLAKLDCRLGDSHWQVPGPDGKFGFSGSCFPKDVNGLIAVARNLGVLLRTLEASWEINLAVRPEKDWENLKGRAVVS